MSFALRRHLPLGATIETFAGCLDAVLVESGADASDTDSAYRCPQAHSTLMQTMQRLHDDKAVNAWRTRLPLCSINRRPAQCHAVVLHRRLDAAATKLSSQLQNCGSLPLKITSVQPLGAASRHMAPFAPQPSSLAGSSVSSEAGAPRVMEAVELLVTLEGSGDL